MTNLTNKKGFDSQSEADLALASMIAAALDEKYIPRPIMAQLIETIFNQSGLAKREKWRGRSDYRRRTIEKAISNLNGLSSIDNGYSSEAPEPKYVEKDLKNAHLFADQFAEKLIYVRNFKKWFHWDGNTWKICEHGEEVQAAEIVCRKMLNEATKLQREGHPEGNRLVREATDISGVPRAPSRVVLHLPRMV